MTSDDRSESIALARRVANLARERRGTDVVVMDVRALVDYADAFIVVTGQSARQNLAIAEHVVKSLKADKTYAISKSGLDTGTWICLDLGDVVVHVFDPETRARYDLELLWADAPRVDPGPAPALVEGVGAPAVVDSAPEPELAQAESLVDVDAKSDAPAKPKRRRAVRRAAVEEADAENAPDSERPPEGEPEAGADEAPVVREKVKPLRVASKPAPAARSPKSAPAKSSAAKAAKRTKAAPERTIAAKPASGTAAPVKPAKVKPPKPARITKESADAFKRKSAAKKRPRG